MLPAGPHRQRHLHGTDGETESLPFSLASLGPRLGPERTRRKEDPLLLCIPQRAQGASRAPRRAPHVTVLPAPGCIAQGGMKGGSSARSHKTDLSCSDARSS